MTGEHSSKLPISFTITVKVQQKVYVSKNLVALKHRRLSLIVFQYMWSVVVTILINSTSILIHFVELKTQVVIPQVK